MEESGKATKRGGRRRRTHGGREDMRGGSPEDAEEVMTREPFAFLKFIKREF